jgi:hypothetical protein
MVSTRRRRPKPSHTFEEFPFDLAPFWGIHRGVNARLRTPNSRSPLPTSLSYDACAGARDWLIVLCTNRWIMLHLRYTYDEL